MILFFKTQKETVIATEVNHQLNDDETAKLAWLYGDATLMETRELEGFYVGPRREMVTPWSTNAVEITQNMNLNGISRIEEFFPVASRNADYDPMLQRMYEGIGQEVFCVDRQPEPVKHVDNLEEYNEKEGLALSTDEMAYLHDIEKQLGRPLTDSEIFGFAQINSEHCRHKIFGGTFIIDGEEKESSLFAMIKRTTAENPGNILSAYKDNVAFAQGPVVEQFAPKDQSKADYFEVKDIESVISLKAETHNFPTTVEPFNGAATGTGGEIRDRMGGGVGSWPIAGTAVYMTAYPVSTADAIGKSCFLYANGSINRPNRYLLRHLMVHPTLVISSGNHLSRVLFLPSSIRRKPMLALRPMSLSTPTTRLSCWQAVWAMAQNATA